MAASDEPPRRTEKPLELAYFVVRRMDRRYS
jgi:hypothetical protein